MRELPLPTTRSVPRVNIGWVSALMAAVVFLGIGLWRLDAAAPWWDEGWTLSVARTWVEQGFYGRLLDGKFAPPGLEAAFPTTASVALSFRLFGVGVWQGRLVGVVFTLIALGLLLIVARQLYDRRVAVASIAVALLLSMHPQLHPLILGRQVLAEMPMLCGLLGGYSCFAQALRRSRWWLLPAIVLWAIGLIAKAQALPFWALSLLLPLGWLVSRRAWRGAGWFGAALIGSYGATYALRTAITWLLQGRTLPPVALQGLYQVIALVPYSFVRIFAVQFALTFGLPTLLGLGYGAWQWLRGQRQRSTPVEVAALRLALLTLVASWFGWFTLLSIGGPRYLFPATFVGSIFVALLLDTLTAHFDLARTLQRASAFLSRRAPNRTGFGAVIALLLLAMALPLTGLTIARYYFAPPDTSAQQVAAFLNTQTPPDALIETYDSELQFLLNRPYHFPPDQTHVDLIRQSFGEPQSITYDPLAANPDYLVVGSFIRKWHLYDSVIAAGNFRLIRSYGAYDLYQRVR